MRLFAAVASHHAFKRGELSRNQPQRGRNHRKQREKWVETLLLLVSCFYHSLPPLLFSFIQHFTLYSSTYILIMLLLHSSRAECVEQKKTRAKKTIWTQSESIFSDNWIISQEGKSSFHTQNWRLTLPHRISSHLVISGKWTTGISLQSEENARMQSAADL